MKIIGLSIAAIAFSVCFSSCTALSRWLCTDNVMPDIMEVSTFAIDSLHDCDLLFQASVSGNAITDVTRGVDDMNIDHVGVFARIDGRPSVIEALPGHGVCVTPLDSFLCRRMSPEGVPQVVVGPSGLYSAWQVTQRFGRCLAPQTSWLQFLHSLHLPLTLRGLEEITKCCTSRLFSWHVRPSLLCF